MSVQKRVGVGWKGNATLVEFLRKKNQNLASSSLASIIQRTSSKDRERGGWSSGIIEPETLETLGRTCFLACPLGKLAVGPTGE